jgi:hypothetical protein
MRRASTIKLKFVVKGYSIATKVHNYEQDALLILRSSPLSVVIAGLYIREDTATCTPSLRLRRAAPD